MATQLSSGHHRHGLARAVVAGRSETSSQQYDVRTADRYAKCAGNIAGIVTYDGLKADFNAKAGEPIRKKDRVGLHPTAQE
jgi:hypothetical protein